MKNIVVVRAGSKSLHKEWVSEKEESRKFDILVCCYSKEAMNQDRPGLMHMYSPGSKISGFNHLIKDEWRLLSKYLRIAFMDDDIRTTHENIHRCFEIGEKEKFAIWQPSLNWSSYFTYAGTLQIKGLSVRYVNYVEMMAPFFKIEALFKIKDLFDMGFESGIDLIWCNLVLPEVCGIVDETPVNHTRPVGGQKEQNGFVDRRYEDDIENVLEKYNYIWPSLVSRGGRKINGNSIGRKVSTIYAIQLFWGFFQNPNKRYLRLVGDHIRHMMTRSFAIRLRKTTDV